MQSFKDVAKGGWHPPGKGDKGKESWRGDFKGIGQVAGWMGKGRDTSALEQAQEHQSRPLNSLKDPSSFGPPPKSVQYHGAAAAPDRITPVKKGLGAPIVLKPEPQVQQEEEEGLKPPPPPVPYRADTTGLSTQNLPKPPQRRDDQNASPTMASPGGASRGVRVGIGAKPKPSVPPRLPPRSNSTASTDLTNNASDAPPPAYSVTSPHAPPNTDSSGYLNQGAMNRLGSAGVSVPGFGIGGGNRTFSPSQPASKRAQATPLAGLSSRFSNLSTGDNNIKTSYSPASPTFQNQTTSPVAVSPASSGGTTWAQKQAALKTASSFRNDPSSVSFSDARSAASTANNFRERHGEQVSSGMRTANGLNQKYGLAGKLNSFNGGGVGGMSDGGGGGLRGQETSAPVQEGAVAEMGLAAKKKPAPPPPPKKVGSFGDVGGGGGAPPPVPLGSKPR
ncbi:hypothetical protein MMC25_008221 [Agyrium rufum]|nr:hypothetical protein [Agyrium rufum]